MYSRQQAFRIAEALIRSSEHPHPRQPEAPPRPPSPLLSAARPGRAASLSRARLETT